MYPIPPLLLIFITVPLSWCYPQTPNFSAKFIQSPKRHRGKERVWSGQLLAPQISKRKIRTGVRNKTRGYIRAIHTSLRFTSDLPEIRIFSETQSEPQNGREGERAASGQAPGSRSTTCQNINSY